jgi:hypothetical protein
VERLATVGQAAHRLHLTGTVSIKFHGPTNTLKWLSLIQLTASLFN